MTILEFFIKNPQYGVARWLVTKPDDQSLIPQTHRVEREKWTPTEKYFWIPSSGFLHQCNKSEQAESKRPGLKREREITRQVYVTL